MDPSYYQSLLKKVQQGGPRQSDLKAFQPFPLGNQQQDPRWQQYQKYLQMQQQQQQQQQMQQQPMQGSPGMQQGYN